MDNRVQGVIENLMPMDDSFFHKLSEEPAFCEEVLQVILQKKNLKVVEVTVQKSLRNVEGRSVVVDVLCRDDKGKYYNIEVQKQREDDCQRRVRYNGSNIDTYVTEKGVKFEDIPDVYVVFITQFDYFQKNKTIYHIDRILRETGEAVDNGFHEIYVNTAVDDGTDIAALMKIFTSRSIKDDVRFPKVCERIRYFKEGKGGNTMCSTVEEYAKEYAKEYAEEYVREYTKGIVREMIEMGLEDEAIHRATKLSMNEIGEIRKNTIQHV